MKTLLRPVFPILLFLASGARGQNNAADYVVPITATVRETPPTITLHWTHGTHATAYTLYRRPLGQIGDWGTAQTLKASDSVYVDNSVQVGQPYEYFVFEQAKAGTTVWTARGFIASGIDVLPGVRPGIVVLLVDRTYVSPLASEIARLESDLQAEGWN